MQWLNSTPALMHFLHVWTRVVQAVQPFGPRQSHLRHDTDESTGILADLKNWEEITTDNLKFCYSMVECDN